MYAGPLYTLPYYSSAAPAPAPLFPTAFNPCQNERIYNHTATAVGFCPFIFWLGFLARLGSRSLLPRALNARPQYPPIAVTFYGQNFCWPPLTPPPPPLPAVCNVANAAPFLPHCRGGTTFFEYFNLRVFKVPQKYRKVINNPIGIHFFSLFLQNQVFIFTLRLEWNISYKKTHSSLSCFIIYNYYLNIQYKKRLCKGIQKQKN